MLVGGVVAGGLVVGGIVGRGGAVVGGVVAGGAVEGGDETGVVGGPATRVDGGADTGAGVSPLTANAEIPPTATPAPTTDAAVSAPDIPAPAMPDFMKP
jgi:hypothetical protein